MCGYGTADLILAKNCMAYDEIADLILELTF